MTNIQEQVEEIQDQIFDKDINTFFLTYKKSGYVEAIGLNIILHDINIEVDLWNDQDDTREIDEDTDELEPLKNFLKKKVKECIKSFEKLNEIL